MKSKETNEPQIATSSTEEGLDFACSLIVDAIIRYSEAHPEQAKELLQILANYIQFRYVGELGLAAEYLADIGVKVESGSQFARQMEWIEKRMKMVPTMPRSVRR